MKLVDKVGTPAPGHAPAAIVRDRPTVLLYATLGLLGYWLNGLGSVLGQLQRQLHVDRGSVAFYPSMFAVALIAVGLLAGRAAERVGHRVVLAAGLAAMTAGALLLATPWQPLTLLGAVLLGVGCALLVQVVPSAVTERHPADPAVVLGEANAVSSWASVLAPAAVALAVAIQLGWWVGYTIVMLPCAAYLISTIWRGPWFHRVTPAKMPDTVEDSAVRPGLEPGALLGRWIDVVLAVSVEFCLVFWAADAFREWHHAGDAAATALAAAFLVGMASGRTFAARLIGGRHPLIIVLAASITAGAGFAGFWLPPITGLAVIGLLVTGMGVSLLYPVTLARLLAAWPGARDRAAARGALASGLAIGVAPLVLARVADAIGLRTAYLIVPILLAALAAHAGWGSVARSRSLNARHSCASSA